MRNCLHIQETELKRNPLANSVYEILLKYFPQLRACRYMQLLSRQHNVAVSKSARPSRICVIKS